MNLNKKCILPMALSLTLVSASVQPIYANTKLIVEIIVGEDRYDTAKQISDRHKNYENVILVNADKNLSDGLSASGLSGTINAPILLTHKDSIPEKTLEGLKKARNVYIIGGLEAISLKVENKMKEEGKIVKRLAGEDRIETSYEVAKEISKYKNIDQIYFANGYKGEADAMSISSVAAKNSNPIILTDGKNFNVDVSKTDNYVIGGNLVMDDSIVNKTKSLRLGGINRFETNIKVIEHFYKNSKEFILTKGWILVDALTSSSLKKPTLLVEKGTNKRVLNGAEKIIKIGGIADDIYSECLDAINLYDDLETNIDIDGNGKPDINIDIDGDGKPDINIDIDKDGKPDINVDTDGDGKPDINVDTDGDGKPDINIDIDGDGKPDINIDIDKDGEADINIDTDKDGKPDINIDTDKDGKPDINIDTDKDGKPDINIDTDKDGKPDINIDTDKDGKPDINVDTDKDGKPDINIDTDKDGKPDINVDTDKDGKPDINIDTDKDGKPDINIDTDKDGKPDVNVDTDKDGKPDINIDTDKDGKPDINVDTDKDGKPDINIDTDKDGKPDINVDTDKDGKPDINIDTDKDGKPDINIDTDKDGKPDINIDTDKDGKPDINVDIDGDGNPDIDIDTDGDGKPDKNESIKPPTVIIKENNIEVQMNEYNKDLINNMFEATGNSSDDKLIIDINDSKVDDSKAGEYEVIIKVTNSNDKSTEKIVKVTIVEPQVNTEIFKRLIREEMYKLLNQHRHLNAIPELKTQQRLEEMANKWAMHMEKEDFYSSIDPETGQTVTEMFPQYGSNSGELKALYRYEIKDKYTEDDAIKIAQSIFNSWTINYETSSMILNPKNKYMGFSTQARINGNGTIDIYSILELSTNEK